MRLRMRVSAVSESPPRSLPQALCFVTMKPGRRLVGGWTPDASSIFRPGVQAEHGYANGYVSGSDTRLIGLFHGSRGITGEPLVPPWAPLLAGGSVWQRFQEPPLVVVLRARV